jgi:hypothetical protein
VVRRWIWSQLYLIRNSDGDLLKTCIWKPDNIMENNTEKDHNELDGSRPGSLQ